MTTDLHLRVAARPEEVAVVRRALRTWLGTLEVDAAAEGDLALILTELAANAVNAAAAVGPGDVEIEVRACADPPGGVILAVTGPGPVLQLGELPDDPLNPEAESGRGLAIVRALAGEVAVEREGDLTTVRVRHPAPEAAAADQR